MRVGNRILSWFHPDRELVRTLDRSKPREKAPSRWTNRPSGIVRCTGWCLHPRHSRSGARHNLDGQNI